jgi:glycosyltransferase involved in cell wall biosynthesis
VLLVSHKSKVWGIQRRLLVLAPHLAERGVRITLAAPPDSHWATLWETTTGLEFVPLTLPEHLGLRQPGTNRRASVLQVAREAAVVAESARRIAALSRPYDLLFSGSLAAHAEVAIAGRLARRPAVLMLVDIVAPGFGRRLLRSAASLSWATVVNSTATMATLGGSGRPRLIHPAIDLQVFHPGTPDPGIRSAFGATTSDVLVGIVGRVDEEKGIDTLVDAIGTLRRRGLAVRLAIVGDVGTGPEPYGQRVREHAERVLGDHVFFAGRRDDIPDVIRSLDVLVNASVAEPFGMSVLEAHASGVAVVATAAGGVTDFVRDDENGILVPPRDVQSLADAVGRLVDKPELRQRLGAAGRRSAEVGFDVRNQFDRYESLFREAAASRR